MFMNRNASLAGAFRASCWLCIHGIGLVFCFNFMALFTNSCLHMKVDYLNGLMFNNALLYGWGELRLCIEVKAKAPNRFSFNE